jgi:hypothetical protein
MPLELGYYNDLNLNSYFQDMEMNPLRWCDGNTPAKNTVDQFFFFYQERCSKPRQLKALTNNSALQSASLGSL